MSRANRTNDKRTKAPFFSSIRTAPASVMVPQLCVGLSAIALIAIGVVMVYSASSITGFVENGSATAEAFGQLRWAVLGLITMAVMALFFNERFAAPFTWGLWGICVLLVIATQLVGTSALGAQRWLVVGGMSIQPAEFAKIAFVLVAARLVVLQQEGQMSEWRMVGLLAATVLAPLAFILAFQSDMGTTMICMVSILALMWLCGCSRSVFIAVAVVVFLLAVVVALSKPYRVARLMSFVNPWADPQGDGYQLIHSLQALAAGGFFGVGVGNSYEKMLYLPEAETDFIFAIVGEELGLVGTVGVVALFCAILYGSIRIALGSPDRFGLLVAGPLATMLVFQAFLNIACVIGVAPITGKPLPFLSSGGSSMLSSCMIVGMVLAVSRNFSGRDDSRQRRGNLRVMSSSASQERTARTSMHGGSRPAPHDSRRSRGAGYGGGYDGVGRGSTRRHSREAQGVRSRRRAPGAFEPRVVRPSGRN